MNITNDTDTYTIREKIDWCLTSAILDHCDRKCINFIKDIEKYVEGKSEAELRETIPELLYVGFKRPAIRRQVNYPTRKEIFSKSMQNPFLNNAEKKRLAQSFAKEEAEFKSFLSDGKTFLKKITNYSNERREQYQELVAKLEGEHNISDSSIKAKKVIDYNPIIHVIKNDKKNSNITENVEKQSDFFKEQ